MKLSKLLERMKYTVLEGGECEITGFSYDSRKVKTGDIFVCIKGAVFDGHDKADEVLMKGAACIVIEKDVREDILTNSDASIILVDDTRLALAQLSAAWFGYPAEKLTTIGITGTKGKTTTTYMVKNSLEACDIKCGLIGTIETIIGNEKIPAVNTTPESYVVQETFDKMVKAGITHVVMEVSSQGLMLHRVGGFTFDFGVFTNLEKDHIGPNEHKDFEDYANCKAMLFKQCKVGIFNVDDDGALRMMKDATCKVETFGTNKGADLRAKDMELFQEKGIVGIKYNIAARKDYPVVVNVPGKFSLYNSLCAIAICKHFVKDITEVITALRTVSVKGRSELVPVSDKFSVMVDYAHNAMSLESLLTAIREYNPKRIVCLFGCGGNRSRDRRFEMGEVSSSLADFTIVTSDNPRNEEPAAIIEDILVGVKRGGGEYMVIEDRKEAIGYALQFAKEGDIVIVAGKGHEDYQEIKGVKHHFDDREVIEELAKGDSKLWV